MSPNAAPEAGQQTGNRKRAPSERVVPAIPLALSRPKPGKTNKRTQSDVKARAEQQDAEHGLPVGGGERGVVVNGGGQLHGEATSVDDEKFIESAVRMPTNGAIRPRRGMSISIGAMDDTPATPPPTEQPSMVGSPGSARKPTDRFDMRHIRTELPPLAPTFVPAAEQHTPRSAASSQSNRPHNNHAPHPSANGVMFGSQGSSTSSPAPPLSAGSGFVPPQHGPQQQQPPYFTPHGHAHHASEPHPQRLYQPMNPQHAMPWNMRHPYGQPPPQGPYFHPHNHMAFRYPPRDIFTPVEAQQPNGRSSRSRSASQDSSAAYDQKTASTQQPPMSSEDAPESAKAIQPEPKAAFTGHGHPRPSHPNHQVPPPPPPQYAPPDVASRIDNAESLRNHVFSEFGESAFTDCRLRIEPERGVGSAFDGHRIILSRSPTLRELLQSMPAGSSSAEIPIKLHGQYLCSYTFTEALEYLYGGPLLQIDHHRPGSSAGERGPSNGERMGHALSYIVTGAWLKIPPVAARGVEVAARLLHWDTISIALGFALDGGLSQVWNVEDGSEDKASNSSDDGSLGRSETIVAPTYDPYATNLLQRIVDFTVHVFPPNFYLDASATHLDSCSRLPTLPPTHESKQSRSDPRLSQIRFGEVPIEEHQRPSFATTTISSMLLSLPFQLLKCVLEHYDLTVRLGPETVASIMRQVVAERETRRNRVLKARAGRPSRDEDESEGQLVQNLYWQESVEASEHHRAGFRLARRKRDIDTPPSSGACSERNK